MHCKSCNALVSEHLVEITNGKCWQCHNIEKLKGAKEELERRFFEKHGVNLKDVPRMR